MLSDSCLVLFTFPKLPRGHALHAIEEASKGGDFCEMELVGDLSDAQRGLAQEEGGFHQQHLVDVAEVPKSTKVKSQGKINLLWDFLRIFVR